MAVKDTENSYIHAVGYCFGENSDHMATPDIPDIATRDAKAELGAELICKMVDRMNMAHVVEQLRKLEQYGLENEEKYPWCLLPGTGIIDTIKRISIIT